MPRRSKSPARHATRQARIEGGGGDPSKPTADAVRAEARRVGQAMSPADRAAFLASYYSDPLAVIAALEHHAKRGIERKMHADGAPLSDAQTKRLHGGYGLYVSGPLLDAWNNQSRSDAQLYDDLDSLPMGIGNAIRVTKQAVGVLALGIDAVVNTAELVRDTAIVANRNKGRILATTAVTIASLMAAGIAMEAAGMVPPPA